MTIFFRHLSRLTTFSIVLGLISAESIASNPVLAQSTDGKNQKIEKNMLKKGKQTVHRIGTTFSNRNENRTSIKSTDANIHSRHPQSLECWNCDSDNYIVNTTEIMPDGIIYDIIRSEIFRKRARKHHTHDLNNKSYQRRHFDNTLYKDNSSYNDTDATFNNNQKCLDCVND